MGANAHQDLIEKLAGEVGIEPTNVGIKIRCLTTWRLPNKPLATSINSVVVRIAALRGARNPHVRIVHSGCCAPGALHFIPKTEFLEASFETL